MKFIIPNLASTLFIASFAPIRAQDCITDTDGSATIWNSDADMAASAAHRGDNMYGMIFRNRFDTLVPCEETNSQICTPWDDLIKDHDVCNGSDGMSGDCGVAANFWHDDIKTPNQVYPYGGGAFDPDSFNYPVVGYAAWTSWDMNPNGWLQGYAFYPTDSNSNDHRDWLNEGGLPGQGCHTGQNFQCTNDGCLSQEGDDGQWCKCNFNEFAAENLGDILAASFVDNDDGFWSCIDNDPNCNNGNGPVNGMNNLQPIYQGHDYSSCWVDEGDLLGKGDMNMIIDAQNSIYHNSDNWFDQSTPYWGWNELSFNKQLDDQCDGDQCNQDTLIIVLPSNIWSICDVDKELTQAIDSQLTEYWNDGFSKLPVIVARNTDSIGDEVSYDMEFFTQNFFFESGNCIIWSGDDNNAYYYPSDDASGLCGAWN